MKTTIDSLVYTKIQNILTEYEEATLDFAPTYAPKQKDIIKLIDFYWVSKYKDGDKDALGFLKPFYNVVINPTEVASKMIDIDTKDIRVIAKDGKSYYPAWLFSKELKQWMQEKEFGKLLNEIVYNLPKYGSVVLKKRRGNITIVPLQNLRNNQTIRRLSDDVIIEEHEETLQAFRARKKDWGNTVVDKALAEIDKNRNTIKWYEAYGTFVNETGKKDKNNYYIYSENGTEILAESLSESPYREIHWDKLEGRWLGRGQVEKFFEAQIQQNKVANMKSQSLNWTSKRVWQTKDEGIARNLMTDIQNGDILRVNSEITPVATEERNLSAYTEEERRWDSLVERLGFSYDIMSGRRAPSGTPLGSSILQTQMAGGYFELKREDIGLALKALIFEWILPTFKKEKRIAHKVMVSEFSEDELVTLRALIVQSKVNTALVEYITKSGNVPDESEIDTLKQVVEMKVKSEKQVEIPAKFYDNLEYKLDIIITNEQIDLAAKFSAVQVVIQMLGSNPTILQDPNTKKYFMQLLEIIGISPASLESVESIEEPQAVPARVGGSVARTPAPTALPAKTNTTQTL